MKKNSQIILSSKQALLFYGIESKKPFEIDGNMANVGEMLKHAREFRNISIELLAAKLNLEPRIIRRIEANRLETLAGKIFVKGYISLLARELSADIEPLMRVYELQSQPEEASNFRLESTGQITIKKKFFYALIVLVFALSVYYLSYAIQTHVLVKDTLNNSLDHFEN